MPWSPIDYAFVFFHMLGLVFIVAALFLYEDEEKRIQNKLEQWWVNLSDKGIASRSRVAAFMQETAKLTGRGFDRLLGKRLLSLRFTISSVCFSLASLFLFGFAVLMLRLSHNPPATASPRSAFLWFLVFLALGLVPAFTNSKLVLRLWWFVIFIGLLQFMGFLLGFLLFVTRTKGAGVAARGVGYVFLPFAFSLFCDLTFIVITRLILRQIAKSERVYHIVLAMLVNLLSMELLIWLPIFVGAKLTKFSPLGGGTVMLSFPLNSLDFIVAFAAVIVAVVLLLHRLLWPVMQRPLYAICRFAPLNHKWLLWGIGLTLILLPRHNTIEFLKSRLKL